MSTKALKLVIPIIILIAGRRGGGTDSLRPQGTSPC